MASLPRMGMIAVAVQPIPLLHYLLVRLNWSSFGVVRMWQLLLLRFRTMHWLRMLAIAVALQHDLRAQVWIRILLIGLLVLLAIMLASAFLVSRAVLVIVLEVLFRATADVTVCWGVLPYYRCVNPLEEGLKCIRQPFVCRLLMMQRLDVLA